MTPGRERFAFGLAILAGVLLVTVAFLLLFRQSRAAGGIEGIILNKQFQSAPETQITVGKRGVHRREQPGVYLFEVKPMGGAGKIYSVTVDPKTYAEHRSGDHFYFVPSR